MEKTVEQPVQQAVKIRQQTRQKETAWQEERSRLLDEVAHLQKENEALAEATPGCWMKTTRLRRASRRKPRS
ncbi:hypothetical protein [Desulfosarcina cetonica]|uniref:hypothetical protein n=1 Tax=Desulfosarcina cetonica TaxID=90730 RepID=UPI0006D04820|nr:hypothetical protein [Desulfosarcina cetonica]